MIKNVLLHFLKHGGEKIYEVLKLIKRYINNLFIVHLGLVSGLKLFKKFKYPYKGFVMALLINSKSSLNYKFCY